MIRSALAAALIVITARAAAHGLIDRPLPEWVEPVAAWAAAP